jgi:hypothetical protein
MTKIAGSGSTPKCHGSATLVRGMLEIHFKRFYSEVLLKDVSIISALGSADKKSCLKSFYSRFDIKFLMVFPFQSYHIMNCIDMIL